MFIILGFHHHFFNAIIEMTRASMETASEEVRNVIIKISVEEAIAFADKMQKRPQPVKIEFDTKKTVTEPDLNASLVRAVHLCFANK